MKAPAYFAENILSKVSLDGRFALYTYDPSVRGRAATAKPKYYVFDTQSAGGTKGGKYFTTLREADGFIHYRLTGEQTSPFFGGATVQSPKTVWASA